MDKDIKILDSGFTEGDKRDIAKWITDVKDELCYMREEFQETQTDPASNFSSENSIEGSGYYIDMTVALKKSIDIIDTGTFKELSDSLKELDNAVNIYYSKREGLTLPKEYEYVEISLDTAMTAQIILLNILEYMREMEEKYPELFTE
ncbi:MAG: hypothetical protein IJ661_04985 [Lachnospiraceae bacterium]|nr:hypothetical protein [Lachnospiraceae bacterium]